MSDAAYEPDCVPPGSQSVLFRVAAKTAPIYSVIDRDGHIRARTNSLGVALSVTRHLVQEQGEAWVRASDDTTAHVDSEGVSSDTPDRPWIQTTVTSLEEIS